MIFSAGGCNPIAKELEDMEKMQKEKERKVVLFIGETGVGKSTLCNTIISSEEFKVSSGTESCTQEVRVKEDFFMGNETKPITIVDTVGFDDASKESDDTETTALIRKLKNDLSHINLFVIVLDGNNPRIDKSQKDMLSLFAVVFGKAFWKHVLVVFTKVSMDPRKVQLRMKKEPERGSDDTWADRYVQGISEKVGQKPKYLFIDARFDEDTPEEERAFTTAMDSLYQTLTSNEGFKTDSVKSRDSEKMKREAAERERNLANQKREEAEKERTESQKKAEVAQKEKEAEEERRKKAEDETMELQRKAEEAQKDKAEQQKIIDNLERQKEEERDKRLKAEIEKKKELEAEGKHREATEERGRELQRKIEEAEKERVDLTQKRDCAEQERDKAEEEKEEERRRRREKEAELVEAQRNAALEAKQRKEEEDKRKEEEVRRKEEEQKRKEEETKRKEEEVKRKEEEEKRRKEEIFRKEEERQRKDAEAKLLEAEKVKQEEATKRIQAEMKLELLTSEKQRIESKREKERGELEETKRQLKQKIDFEEEQEQLKRNSFIGTSAIASITEESGSLVDDDASERLAYQIKKESTQIERGIYKHLKIYKPAPQPTSDSRIQVFGESTKKESKTLMVLGAPDRGKDTFINSLANHLWDVKVPDQFRFKLAFNKEDANSCGVYKLNNTKQN